MRQRRARGIARKLELSKTVIPYIVDALRQHEADTLRLVWKEMNHVQ